MRIPREILSLFPQWEYVCQVCGHYLGYDPVEICPKCHSRIDLMKARRPPRLLKDRNEMARYAREVLAPRLSKKMRKKLLKYFPKPIDELPREPVIVLVADGISKDQVLLLLRYKGCDYRRAGKCIGYSRCGKCIEALKDNGNYPCRWEQM